MTGYRGGTALADVAQLRRYIAEPNDTTYTDAMLIAEIVRYPLPDAGGNWPFLTSGSVNPSWTGTYDLAATAATIWDEKAAGKVNNYDFTADGATYHKEQQYQHYEKQARKWRSRRAPGSYTASVYPPPRDDVFWIGNLAEQD